jgi:hypothetical protein
MQAAIFTFRKTEFPSKNLSLVRLVLTKLSEFFEKFRKERGGHRALGSPRVGSIFALAQRRSLLSPKRCRKHVNTAKDKFGTQRHVNKACNIYLLMYEFWTFTQG